MHSRKSAKSIERKVPIVTVILLSPFSMAVYTPTFDHTLGHIPDCITNRSLLNNSPYFISSTPSRVPCTQKTQTVTPRTSRWSSAKNVSANALTMSIDDSNRRNMTWPWPWTLMAPVWQSSRRTFQCVCSHLSLFLRFQFPADTLIEAPPSLLLPHHYCDITGSKVCLTCLIISMSLPRWRNNHRHHTQIHAQGSGTTTRVSIISSRTWYALSPLPSPCASNTWQAPLSLLQSSSAAKDYFSTGGVNSIFK